MYSCAGDLPVGERRRDLLMGMFQGRRAPEYIKRRGEAAKAGGRCGRIRVESVIGVVVRGEGMVRGRSGMEVVNRIMSVRGEKEGGGIEELMVSSGFGGTAGSR